MSVIIPVYNAVQHLSETLRSVLSQTLGDLECIVVDDGSQDGSRDVTERYAHADPRVRPIYQANSGPSAARNRGFAAADRSTEYVMFLDHDDVLEPHALESLAQALQEDPAAVGAHGLARFIDDGGRAFMPGQAEHRTRNRVNIVEGRVVKWPRAAPTTFGVLLLKDIIFTPGNLLARRRCVDLVGGWDPALRWNADWDFALRLSALAHLTFLDTTVILYRKGLGAMSHEPGAAQATERERQAVLRKLDASADISDEQRQLMYAAEGRRDAVDSAILASYAFASLRNGKLVPAGVRSAQAILYCIKGKVRPMLSRVGMMERRSVL